MNTLFARLTVFLAIAVSTANSVPVWGQCGGLNFNGPTDCDAGLSCFKVNDYYSQCQQGSPESGTTTAQSPAATIPAGALTKITGFGTNPTNIGMYGYRPTTVKSDLGLLVALHYCGGTAQAYYSSTQFKTLADQRGFMILYGQAVNDSNCWDITSKATKTHNGGSDSQGIASAAQYAIANWGINPEKVFVVGSSSGAMMVNVIAATYPDIFKGGAIFAGSAFGCLVSNAPRNPPDPCASGQKTQTAQAWGDLVRGAYPGYNGTYPKLQIWHGTSDPVLNYVNFGEEVKQWTNVHQVSSVATTTLTNSPKQPWTKTSYGTGQVEGYSGSGLGHGLPDSGTEANALNFFGL
ncbi:Alpha/Beta hydrolase protein [Crepidotus variabilis]|uniref:Carboxylic ester hydrolase n=1 Tax=Crepidotus variabilis TaxID=179855 RepID=A0A9P6E679_9AGAR|nr:Alpha/Beta hydrolase protein [Crepidotus variabilis]